MQNLSGVRWCVDGDVGIYSSLNASEQPARRFAWQDWG